MAVRTRTFFIAATMSLLAACGGDDGDGQVVVIDAAPPIDAPTDAAIDALVCNAPNMVCAGQCVNVTTNHDFCGDCNTACTGAQTCTASECACVSIEIDPNPSFLLSQLITDQLPGGTIGFGAFGGGAGFDVIAVGIANTGTLEDTVYNLAGAGPTNLPFVAYGYNVDPNAGTFGAAYFPTTGTVTFSTICATNGVIDGFEGNVEGAVFQEVEGIANPTPVPNGCSIGEAKSPESFSFSFGNVDCAKQ
jgi:hypothetical protein